MVDVVRAPLFVNTAFRKKAVQTDSGRNIAVTIAAATVLIQPMVEPSYYKKKVSAPDIFPNIAVRDYVDAITIYSNDDLPKRGKTQVDVHPNLAVRASAPIAIVRDFIEPSNYKRDPLQLEISPNLALQAVEPAKSTSVFLEPAPAKRLRPQLDIFPNVAIRTIVIQAPLGQWPEPSYYPKRKSQVDLSPNLAVNFPVVATPIPAMVEPTYLRSPLHSLETFPNIALRQSAAEIPRIPAMIQPQLSIRYAPQVIIYPNLAINYVPPGPPGASTVQINLGLSLSRLGGRVWG